MCVEILLRTNTFVGRVYISEVLSEVQNASNTYGKIINQTLKIVPSTR